MAEINNFEVLIDNYLKTAENIITYFDDKNERDKILEDLNEIVKKNCIHDKKLKMITNTVKAIVNDIDDTGDADQIMSLFRDKKNEMIEYNPDVSQHPNLIKYNNQVIEIVNCVDKEGRIKTNDDDIEMTQNEINTIDPFTKLRMIDPVKNKVCGHVYSRESITSIIKKNKNTRCPVIGCISTAPVLLENLASDIVMRKYLYNNRA